jgi:hypothetical protein
MSTANNITMSSTKADIIQASEEYIGDLQSKLDSEQQLSLDRKEERQALIYLLAAVSTYSLLF